MALLPLTVSSFSWPADQGSADLVGLPGPLSSCVLPPSRELDQAYSLYNGLKF